MGYIERDDGLPDFSRAVISFWFRIPQASIDAAVAQYDSVSGEEGLSDFNLPGIIPLITFGSDAVATTSLGSFDISRSFIGVACGPIQDGGDPASPRLFCRLQYDTGAPGGDPPDYPDFFQMGGRMSPFVAFGSAFVTEGQFITVTADSWHHVLVSFDMTEGSDSSYTGSGVFISFGSACTFYWAFDDVNYNEEYLWPSNPHNYGAAGGVNDIISNWCFDVGDGSFSPTSHSFVAGNLPTDANPIGIPASTPDVDHVYNVILADIQVFTGVTLDTSVEENRRAFVTEEGTPASPTLAATLLGKSPELLFIGDWLAGANLGTGGAFTKTGTLTSFTPTPND